MAKYECSVCGYVYDEEKGIPEAGIAPGTAWEEIPEDWVCPLCGATKSEFKLQDESKGTVERKVTSMPEIPENVKELSLLEVSALCSNLARGCQQQYKPEEAALFNELAVYFKNAAGPADAPSVDKLIELIEKDLEENFSYVNAVASEAKDRGAMRALVWSEKVTRILKSLLNRYQKEGDTMLENTGVYVCTICGFVYVGDNVPELCPVCKVPNWKFEKIEGR
ncbi:MAG: rubredoxin [Peptococcales bacterium]|jgi:rubredoxin